MHFLIDCLQFLLFLIGVPIVLFLGYMGIGIGYILLKDQQEKLSNPRCPSCHRKALKRSRFTNPGAPTFRYYGCSRCLARFKRDQITGETVKFPYGGATYAANQARIVQSISVMVQPRHGIQPEEEPPHNDPLGSWFGRVQVGLPEERWPEYDGVPMLPLCQLRCDSIPVLPASLEHIALICVFLSSLGEEAASSQTDRWCVRTYSTLDGLVPLAYPGDTVGMHAYPVTWRVEEEAPRHTENLPEALWFDYSDYLDAEGRCGTRVSKVGGAPYESSEEMRLPHHGQYEFAFQIAVRGDFPWFRGPGGTFGFMRSTATDATEWFLSYLPPEEKETTMVLPVVLGCEREGVSLFIQQYSVPTYQSRGKEHGLVEMPAISYQGRTGKMYQLEDLHTLVRITSGAMALQFVRLRTCRCFRDRMVDELEIMTESEYAAQPEWYRFHNIQPIAAKSLKDRTVLPSKTFTQLGFEPAQVEAIEDGFRITRWTCSGHTIRFGRYLEDACYLKISETVDTHGLYTRTELMRIPVPAMDRNQELLRPTRGPSATDPNELLRPGA